MRFGARGGSGLVRQFGFGAVVVGERTNFAGGVDWLREAGIEVVDVNSQTCTEMLAAFIAKKPGLWNEDIGVD
jgi:creatinine deaminase